jgi:hypothetical protein
MPWISIGQCGHSTTAGDTFEFQLGIEYLKLVCGEVPEGCELGVMWEEFDGMKVGETVSLPSGVGLCWDDTEISDAPYDYVSRCEIALGIFHEAVDWSAIRPEVVNEEFRKSEEPPEELREAEDETTDAGGAGSG